ncbi:MAG: hypothetical protein V3V20_00660 [Algisphaera sp.]
MNAKPFQACWDKPASHYLVHHIKKPAHDITSWAGFFRIPHHSKSETIRRVLENVLQNPKGTKARITPLPKKTPDPFLLKWGIAHSQNGLFSLSRRYNHINTHRNFAPRAIPRSPKGHD